MKKVLFTLSGFVSILTATAQLSVGANGNYTMYKGDFQQSTPGIQARIGYDVTEKASGVLSFTYGLPITQASEAYLEDQTGNTTTAASQIKYKFKTFNLMGHYNFAGDPETMGRFYGMAGIGLVLVSYNETITGTYDKNAYTPVDAQNGTQSGFTINLGLGGEYKLGGPSLFGEAGIALPANQVNGQYVVNAIPAHFILNVGVKFDLGSSSNY